MNFVQWDGEPAKNQCRRFKLKQRVCLLGVCLRGYFQGLLLCTLMLSFPAVDRFRRLRALDVLD